MNFWENKVLFIDGEAIVIDKPAGLAVHPGARTPREPGRLSSPSSFRISSGCRCRSTGSTATRRGCLLLARNPKAHKAFQRAFEEKRVGKTYVAVLDGVPEAEAGRSTWRSARSRPPRRAGGWCRTRAGKAAVTHWRVAAVPRRAGGPRLHAGDRPHPPDPRPCRVGHRHPDRRRSRLRRGQGADAAPRSVAAASSAAPSRRSRRPRRCRRPSSMRGSGDVL